MDSSTNKRMDSSQQLLEFKRRQILDFHLLNRKPFNLGLPKTLDDYLRYNRLKKKWEKFEDTCDDTMDASMMETEGETLDSYIIKTA